MKGMPNSSVGAFALAWFTLPAGTLGQVFTPTGASLGTGPKFSTSAIPSAINLNYASSNIGTFDYGHEVAGIPYFVVTSVSKPLQIELKFSEEFSGLSEPFADGPYYFANGLANTYRVETFNVTGPGRYISSLAQGGQRWELMTLLTSGQVQISEVGFSATISTVDVGNSPSTFSSSSGLYNKVWALGARAATAACIDAGSQPSTWQVTDQGAYVVGQRPATSAYGTDFGVNYRLVFETQIVRTGTGWAFNYGSSEEGYVFVLTSNLPSTTTFANLNKTLTPANTLTLSYGWGPVNQTTLKSYALDEFPISFDINEGQWYAIETVRSSSGYFSVSISGSQIFNVSLSRYSWAPSAGFFAGSSFGFGGYQDTAAYFRNVSVYAENGTIVYNNPLLDATTVLPEFGVETNTASGCMDGAKRDRLVWMGDFYHTSLIIPASTSRWDHVTGTLGYLTAWQDDLGLLSIDPPLGYPPSLKYALGEYGSSYFALEDYQLLGIAALYNYYERTGDLASVQQQWPAWQKVIAFVLQSVDPTSGLIAISGFLGPAYGTAISSLFVQALRGAAIIARDLNDTTSATLYTSTADEVSDGINSHLWNGDVYALSNSTMDDFSTAGIAFAIISGVANATRAASSIAALSSLELFPGYKDSTQVNSSDPTVNISPNTNGFLLGAVLAANVTAPAVYMLEHLWGESMVQKPRYATGASWEYVAQDQTPGLGLYTSLSHPWGGAPTYILPQYVAGIRSLAPGYKVFAIVPGYEGFNLTKASASVKTVYGMLSAKWTLKNGQLTVTVSAPSGTSGTVELTGARALVRVDAAGNSAGASTKIDVGSGTTTVVLQV